MNLTYFPSRFHNKLIQSFTKLNYILQTIPADEFDKYKGLAVASTISAFIEHEIKAANMLEFVPDSEHRISEMTSLLTTISNAAENESGIHHVSKNVLDKFDGYDFTKLKLNNHIYDFYAPYIHFENSNVTLDDGVTIVDGAYITCNETLSFFTITFVTKQKNTNYETLIEPAEIYAITKSFQIILTIDEPVSEQLEHYFDDIDEHDKHLVSDGWGKVLHKIVNWTLGTMLESDIPFGCSFSDFSNDFPSDLREAVELNREIAESTLANTEENIRANELLNDAIQEAAMMGHYEVFRLNEVSDQLDCWLKQ